MQILRSISQVSANRYVVKVNANQIDKSNLLKAKPIQKYKFETLLKNSQLIEIVPSDFKKKNTWISNSTEMIDRHYSKYSPLLNAEVHSGRKQKH